eukprot:7993923-Alexandrium_andersonii.AAC.1
MREYARDQLLNGSGSLLDDTRAAASEAELVAQLLGNLSPEVSKQISAAMGKRPLDGGSGGDGVASGAASSEGADAVSYTHLTLPTICSV